MGNAIYLSDSDEEITKKVMKAVTDKNKIRKDDKADPEKCMVAYYHNIFSEDEKKCIFEECRAGNVDALHVKSNLPKIFAII